MGGRMPSLDEIRAKKKFFSFEVYRERSSEDKKLTWMAENVIPQFFYLCLHMECEFKSIVRLRCMNREFRGFRLLDIKCCNLLLYSHCGRSPRVFNLKKIHLDF